MVISERTPENRHRKTYVYRIDVCWLRLEYYTGYEILILHGMAKWWQKVLVGEEQGVPLILILLILMIYFLFNLVDHFEVSNFFFKVDLWVFCCGANPTIRGQLPSFASL